MPMRCLLYLAQPRWSKTERIMQLRHPRLVHHVVPCCLITRALTSQLSHVPLLANTCLGAATSGSTGICPRHLAVASFLVQVEVGDEGRTPPIEAAVRWRKGNVEGDRPLVLRPIRVRARGAALFSPGADALPFPSPSFWTFWAGADTVTKSLAYQTMRRAGLRTSNYGFTGAGGSHQSSSS